ncbi:aKG-HExxH-type peptide beta-hydroxylase [Actinoplanes derwentensis]|uniref:HEXXH motif-containing protein n=1 Tax=Actinoplanes derwentensis TaxID=113562 RepID=A0A1H1RZ63_9ACTN|nr:HEXXH motif-containing putative peptide modification protein [Actinoplanes derwentensis]GID84559.1 hypothetical protein Ade03nite_34830 [Actinoplanes derwentensis]SDS40955.1 HEXXH motif-containing protein [Actinoplanes derwentensis]
MTVAAPLDLPVGTGYRTEGIAAMPAVLQWGSGSIEAARVHREYAVLLGDRLGTMLAAARSHPRAQALGEGLSALSSRAWLRVLTAPQVSYRLLWPARHEPDGTVDFLADAVEVELSRERAAPAPGTVSGGKTAWSVLGDGWRDATGQFVAGPALPGLPPLDIGSPHALAIDLEGVTDEVVQARTSHQPAEIDRLLAQLTDVRDALATSAPDILEFVVAFTKVLILQPDPEAPTSFSTGSSAQYIGRSVFGNPVLETVDSVLLAEGLVHEAIHSYMYMNERLEPWVINAELYGPQYRTRSPWTGHPLPLRAYLQACFVWYGLLNLWARSTSHTAFDAQRVRHRMAQAARGFLAGDVLAQVAPYRCGIVPELLSTIEQMQAEVVAAAEAVGVGS